MIRMAELDRTQRTRQRAGRDYPTDGTVVRIWAVALTGAALAVGALHAQTPADDWLTWSAASAERTGKAGYVQGRVGGFFDGRLLKTERSYNYKLAATWKAESCGRCPSAAARPSASRPGPWQLPARSSRGERSGGDRAEGHRHPM